MEIGRKTRVRTRNMLPILVTLDVSRLSGWLNADAPCRVEAGGQISMHDEKRPTRRVVEVGRRARAKRTRNMPTMLVTLDVSKVSG